MANSPLRGEWTSPCLPPPVSQPLSPSLCLPAPVSQPELSNAVYKIIKCQILLRYILAYLDFNTLSHNQ